MGNSITLLDEQGEYVIRERFSKDSIDNEVMYIVRIALKVGRIFYHDGSGRETLKVLAMATVKEAIDELAQKGPNLSDMVRERVENVCSFLKKCVEYGVGRGLDSLHFTFM